MKILRETTGTEQDCGSSARELSLHLHLKGCEEGKMTATQKATGGVRRGLSANSHREGAKKLHRERVRGQLLVPC